MEQFKQQFRKLYDSLSGRQRAIVAAVALATLGGLAFLSFNGGEHFEPLYTSLSPEDGAAVIARLKETNVPYKVADNGESILVPSRNVAEARLEVAGAGLPKTGRIGFELFDQTSLGITEFAEQVNYKRALEGELERSVTSLAEVEQTRIHIAFQKESVFRDRREPAKASVLLKLRPGAELGERSATAISHLVAAAVEGLSPDAVAILDMHGNLVARPQNGAEMDASQPSDAMVAYRKNVEQYLGGKINDALRPLLGHGRFHSDVSIECDYTSGEESTESFNPDESVMVTQQRTEEATSTPGAGGAPGTMSNLPRPSTDVALNGKGMSRLTENTSYQTSRVVRRTTIPQGVVKTISVAVLVDHAVRYEGEGADQKRIVEPRSEQELTAIKELVSAAVGLNSERGDLLTIQSLPFETTLRPIEFDVPAEASRAPEGFDGILQRLKDDPALLGAVAVATVVLLAALFWFVRRIRKSSKSATAAAALEGKQDRQEGELGGGGHGQPALLPGAENNDLIAKVHEIVQEDPEISAGVIQEWLLEGSGR